MTGSRRPGHRGRLLGTVLLASAFLLASCSSALRIEPFEDADTPACHQASELWPPAVQGMEPRPVALQTPSVAAWGDPEVIARCGGTPPGPTSSACYDVDGVHWIEIELDDGWSFTTYGRDPAIEVLIPDRYTPALWLLPDFGPAAETIEATAFCSSVGDQAPEDER